MVHSRAFERKGQVVLFQCSLFSSSQREENEFCNCWREIIFSSVIHENEFWVYLIKSHVKESHIPEILSDHPNWYWNVIVFLAWGWESKYFLRPVSWNVFFFEWFSPAPSMIIKIVFPKGLWDIVSRVSSGILRGSRGHQIFFLPVLFWVFQILIVSIIVLHFPF